MWPRWSRDVAEVEPRCSVPAHRASREAASHTLGLKLQTAMLFTGGTPGLLLWHDLLLTGIA